MCCTVCSNRLGTGCIIFKLCRILLTASRLCAVGVNHPRHVTIASTHLPQAGTKRHWTGPHYATAARQVDCDHSLPTPTMVINPTYLARRTRSCTHPSIMGPQGRTLTGGTAVNWQDAQKRVIKSYREWLRAVREPPILLQNSGFTIWDGDAEQG